jgi:hypothetical protein
VAGMSKDLPRLVLVFLLCLGAAVPGVYLVVTKVDVHDASIGGPEGDAAQYVRMFQGVPLEQIPKPFRYRLLTPTLARLVPSPPAALTRNVYDVSPEKIVKFKFAVVDLLALGGAGLFVFLLCEAVGYGGLASLVGSFLYLTLQAVVNMGGAPLTDALSFFFMAAATVCVLRGWSLGLLVSVLLGMFARETTAYVLVPIVFLHAPWRARLTNVLLCVPGIAAYLVFRMVIAPTRSGWNYSVTDMIDNLRLTLTTPSRLTWVLADGGLAFGVLWVLALAGGVALARRRAWTDPRFRLAALVPVAVTVPILLYANIGRLFTLAFPAVIPLALLPVVETFGAGAGARERPAV